MPGRIRARARFAIAFIILGLTLSACGDDDPSGPVDVDIVGVWVMDVTGTASTGRECQISDITLDFARLDENGEPDPNGTVVGAAEFGGPGTAVCTPGGTASFTGEMFLEDIVENGHDVQFTFTDSDGTWFMSGAFTGNGNSMSGEVTFPLRFASSGILEFNGSWTATRS